MDLKVIAVGCVVVDSVGSNDAVHIRVVAIYYNHARLEIIFDDSTSDYGTFTLLTLKDSLNRECSLEQENSDVIDVSLEPGLLQSHTYVRVSRAIYQFGLDIVQRKLLCQHLQETFLHLNSIKATIIRQFESF